MGRQPLLLEGHREPALHESRQQRRRGEDHVNTAVSPTQAEMLAVKVGWTKAATWWPRGICSTAKPSSWAQSWPACLLLKSPKPLSRMKSCQLQEMNREPWPPNTWSSSNRNSLYSLQTHPATTALKQPQGFKEEAGLNPLSTKPVLAPTPKLHRHLYFVLVGLDGIAAALQLKSSCPVISAPCKQLCWLMKCSSAGVTALGGFICILTAACNEVTLLKCSCDLEGLQSLLQHDVRHLELQKITGRVEPGTEAATTTAPQPLCLVSVA